MNGFWAVFKRELKGYFATPLAYVFLVIFLFFAGFLTFRQRFFEMRQADLRLFFGVLPLLLAIMSAATAMRLWAEERRTGSVELLFTLPITVTQAVLGKFVAAWCFLGIALLLTFPLPVTVAYLGNPDGGVIASGYAASFLLSGGFLAIGLFFSAVSKHQVISGVLTGVACAILYFIGMPTVVNYLSTILPAGAVTTIESFSFQNHYESLLRGVIEVKDLLYFLILIAGWVWACTVILDERKAS
ncbi:MAG: ABC transporter permease subunit [Sedimentisphaerales bacterium]|nr:ABC transporter permease subunit [Sedimentisphaerales bacterium]